VLTLAVITLLSQELTKEYSGVYISGEGQPVILDTVTHEKDFRLSIDYPTRFFETYGLKAVDKGGFYGKWQSARTLNLARPNEDNWNTFDWGKRAPIKLKRDTGRLKDVQSDSQSSWGSTTMSFRQVGSRTVMDLMLKQQDVSQLVKGLFYFAGQGSAVRMDGTFRAPQTELTIVEEGTGAARTMTGTLTYAGTTYSLSGARIYGRGAYRLYNQSTGDLAGQGWISWQPTSTVALQIAEGKSLSTDRVVAFIKIPGTGMATGGVVNLTTGQ
jgi:hypothetical protein